MNTAADSDDGACTANLCSLRDAIEAANAGAPAAASITFAIQGGGIPTITLDANGGLPSIMTPVVIDGSVGGAPGIELTSTTGQLTYGLELSAGSSTIRGLIIHGFRVRPRGRPEGRKHGRRQLVRSRPEHGVTGGGDDGIDVDTSSNNTIGGTSAADRNVFATRDSIVANDMSGSVIEGNYFGYDLDGLTWTDSADEAVILGGGGGNNTIGGTAPGSANVMATSQSAIIIGNSTGNTVEGNSIGVNADGSNVDGVDIGVELDGGATGNTIGGSTTAAGNVIGGADDTAFLVEDGGNTFEGNFIGTDRTGAPFDALKTNGEGLRQLHGSSTPNVYADNIVANTSSSGLEFDEGTATVSGNTIFGSGDVAIDLFEAGGVKITQNSLHDNGFPGIFYEHGDGPAAPTITALPPPTIGDDHSIAGTVPTPANGGATTSRSSAVRATARPTRRARPTSVPFMSPATAARPRSPAPCRQRGPEARMTATVTDPTASTSEFSACVDATVTSRRVHRQHGRRHRRRRLHGQPVLAARRDQGREHESGPRHDRLRHPARRPADDQPLSERRRHVAGDHRSRDDRRDDSARDRPEHVGITIDGGDGVATGLHLAAASDGSTIRGLALVNLHFEQPTAALVLDSTDNTIAGNYIGLTATGAAGNNSDGIDVTGDGNTIGGSTPADANVIVNSGDAGIAILGSSDFPVHNTTIEGNVIGLLPDGKTPAPNQSGGVEVAFGDNTQIGGPDPADGNVISANGTDGDILLGNFGDSSGSNTHSPEQRDRPDGATSRPSRSVSLTSENGIQVADRGFNTIADNVIGGTYQGIDVCDSPNNTIVRNIVGSNTASAAGPDFGVAQRGHCDRRRPVPRGRCPRQATRSAGTRRMATPSFTPSYTTSPSTPTRTRSRSTPSASTKGGPNVQVAGNDNLIDSNTITGAQSGGSPGSGVAGNGVQVDSGTGNTITENSIDQNDALGIDLGGDGVTPNDASDDDSGANDLQNFPDLTSVSLSGGSLTVDGTLSTEPGTCTTSRSSRVRAATGARTAKARRSSMTSRSRSRAVRRASTRCSRRPTAARQ